MFIKKWNLLFLQYKQLNKFSKDLIKKLNDSYYN